jgi:hypothetical protein
MQWLREWGVTSAVTEDSGLASRQSDAMLPRFPDSGNVTEEEFLGLSGFGALLPPRAVAEAKRQILEERLRATVPGA